MNQWRCDIRYSNSELFEVSEEEYQKWLDDMTAREFFIHCELELRSLIADSVRREDWNSQEQKKLRAYRTDAIEFYKQKRGIK